MNKNIEQLYSIAQKPSRKIIGLMSGTSLDGLDIALCNIEGSGTDTKVTIEHFDTISYTEELKQKIKAIFSKHDVDLEQVTLINAWLGKQHAAMINSCLKKWNIPATAVDIIASHGQTIYHAPQILHGIKEYGNATLQIADGDHIAAETGIITICDFRQKHIAHGGEGAPLAVYGDYLIFSKKNENRIMLNMGGIANFTYLAGDLDATKMFSTDVGPGNTMMDQLVQKYFAGQHYDKDAALAKKGTVNQALLRELEQYPFFADAFPKTTGPEMFNLAYLAQSQEKTNTKHLSIEDCMATLCKFSANIIINAVVKTMQQQQFTVYCSGGGMHNPLLMEHLKTGLPNTTFYNTDTLGINPDAKEAVLFAILANETLCGGNTNFGQGVPNVSMGKVCFAR
jgi:anhydro-N-acetylmuramic acid kinase